MSKKALPTDASGFVVLSEYVPHILQEIRYHSTYNFSANGSTAMRSRSRCFRSKRQGR